ncbi:hypothetical protein AGMMS50293_09910 [Spirochaetia bacterium]|nr:hypothetical protein AGMMS50293_09910 [Spirochaetia bacterium]
MIDEKIISEVISDMNNFFAHDGNLFSKTRDVFSARVQCLFWKQSKQPSPKGFPAGPLNKGGMG